MAADGADLDAIHPDQGSTALYLAALRGEKTMVSTLLEAGANPDAANAAGLTGLGAAAHAGHADVLAMILDAGASVDLLNQAEEAYLLEVEQRVSAFRVACCFLQGSLPLPSGLMRKGVVVRERWRILRA